MSVPHEPLAVIGLHPIRRHGVEGRAACDKWCMIYNAFSAGQEWGRTNVSATVEQVMDACEDYASFVVPHECGAPPKKRVKRARKI